MKLLATVTAAGILELDVIPEKPIFLIHQYSGTYTSGNSYLVGLTINSGGTDYEFENSATHYFGRDMRTGSNHYAAQSMIFVPTKETIRFGFGATNPPTKSNRILIFQ